MHQKDNCVIPPCVELGRSDSERGRVDWGCQPVGGVQAEDRGIRFPSSKMGKLRSSAGRHVPGPQSVLCTETAVARAEITPGGLTTVKPLMQRKSTEEGTWAMEWQETAPTSPTLGGSPGFPPNSTESPHKEHDQQGLSPTFKRSMGHPCTPDSKPGARGVQERSWTRGCTPPFPRSPGPRGVKMKVEAHWSPRGRGPRCGRRVSSIWRPTTCTVVPRMYFCHRRFSRAHEKFT